MRERRGRLRRGFYTGGEEVEVMKNDRKAHQESGR
jgi:hypothetical protein